MLIADFLGRVLLEKGAANRSGFRITRGRLDTFLTPDTLDVDTYQGPQLTSWHKRFASIPSRPQGNLLKSPSY
jgi:hypothetical protein